MTSQERFSEHKKWLDLAHAIETFKAGQKSQTLDLILADIRAGKIESAKTECFTNGDKIADRFPKIKEILAEQLFDKNERNPFVIRSIPDNQDDD